MHLLIMGAPGSGKGTCAVELKSYYSIPHISTGEIFRKAIANKTKTGLIAQSYIDKGQAYALSKILKELNIKLDAAINLQIEDKYIEQRIINRRMCENCGRGYNLISLKPKNEGICDVCGGKLYQRKDDTIETIDKRLVVYNTQTKPIIAYYKKLGILIDVDSNQEIEKVVSEIINKVKEK